MSMFSIFNVSGSAVSAQSQRLNVVASNLANIKTPGYKKFCTYLGRRKENWKQ